MINIGGKIKVNGLRCFGHVKRRHNENVVSRRLGEIGIEIKLEKERAIEEMHGGY